MGGQRQAVTLPMEVGKTPRASRCGRRTLAPHRASASPQGSCTNLSSNMATWLCERFQKYFSCFNTESKVRSSCTQKTFRQATRLSLKAGPKSCEKTGSLGAVSTASPSSIASVLRSSLAFIASNWIQLVILDLSGSIVPSFLTVAHLFRCAATVPSAKQPFRDLLRGSWLRSSCKWGRKCQAMLCADCHRAECGHGSGSGVSKVMLFHSTAVQLFGGSLAGACALTTCRTRPPGLLD